MKDFVILAVSITSILWSGKNHFVPRLAIFSMFRRIYMNISGDKLSTFYTWNWLVRLWCNACTNLIILLFLPSDQLGWHFSPEPRYMAAVCFKLSWHKLKMTENIFLKHFYTTKGPNLSAISVHSPLNMRVWEVSAGVFFFFFELLENRWGEWAAGVRGGGRL